MGISIEHLTKQVQRLQRIINAQSGNLPSRIVVIVVGDACKDKDQIDRAIAVSLAKYGLEDEDMAIEAGSGITLTKLPWLTFRQVGVDFFTGDDSLGRFTSIND